MALYALPHTCIGSGKGSPCKAFDANNSCAGTTLLRGVTKTLPITAELI